jgi:transcriptional regulator with XRE-family HTH domain
VSIHSIFADNLRSQAANYGTIADVCRGTGINRQQFNKYLAGNSIPSAITLRKICGFLGIAEHELFVSPQSKLNPSQQVQKVTRSMPGTFRFDGSKYDFDVPEVPLGFYHCLIPLQAVSGMLVRSLIYVRQNGRQKEFIRLTKLPAASGGANSFMNSRHHGIIFANKSFIYFLGFDRHPPHHCTLMSVQRPIGENSGMLQGTIMTNGVNSAISSKLCLFYIKEQTIVRSHITKLGIVHQTNAECDPLIVFALNS